MVRKRSQTAKEIRAVKYFDRSSTQRKTLQTSLVDTNCHDVCNEQFVDHIECRPLVQRCLDKLWFLGAVTYFTRLSH